MFNSELIESGNFTHTEGNKSCHLLNSTFQLLLFRSFNELLREIMKNLFLK